jgi:cytochrome c oxidase assembly protein subunit 11
MSQTNPHKKLLIILVSVVIGMCGFAYALVPIYNTLCRTFGINGKPDLTPELPSSSIVQNRSVIVEFLTTENKSLPWTFYPKIKKISVHPGASAEVVFYARNDSDHTMVVQAIPSITPGPAARYFKKTECFCFTQQTLKAHEEMDLSLLFHLDPKLPEYVNTLTLGYTLFDVTNRVLPQDSLIGDEK